MAFSNTRGSMLLSTGNKSELAVGYCTLYGDMCGGLAVLSDVPKTLVYDLARFVNRRHAVIPESSLTKAPSAELRPNQTDQDSLPPYDQIDRIIEAYVERDLDPDAIIATGLDPLVVRSVIARIDRNEVQATAGGPGLEDHVESLRCRAPISDRRQVPRRRPVRRSRRHRRQRRPSRSLMRRASQGPARVDVGALARRLPDRPVTRFAPSPTGHLHLGHVVNAIYVWGIARALGGAVQLRLENHDLTRSRSAFEQSILDDLEWLGLVPDSPPIDDLRGPGPSSGRQMDRPERYRSALADLTARGLTYWCDCSRARLELQPAAPDGERRYDGCCRHRGLGPGPDRGVRLRLEPGAEVFDDGRLGETTQEPANQCGDVLVRDRLAQWTYQLAVAVDDWVDGVHAGDSRRGPAPVDRTPDRHRTTDRPARARGFRAPPAPRGRAGREVEQGEPRRRPEPPPSQRHVAVSGAGQSGRRMRADRGATGHRNRRTSGFSRKGVRHVAVPVQGAGCRACAGCRAQGGQGPGCRAGSGCRACAGCRVRRQVKRASHPGPCTPAHALHPVPCTVRFRVLISLSPSAVPSRARGVSLWRAPTSRPPG